MALEKFCFTCTLQKGTFIWGVLSTVFYFTILITTVSSDFFMKIVSAEHVSLLYWTLLVSSSIHLIASVLLCVGVWKKYHYIFLPWMIVNGIFLVPVAFIALIGFLAAIPILGPIYIWWCICTYYLKIRDDRTLFFQLDVFDSN